MKAFIVLASACLIAFSSAAPSSSLDKDLHDFLDLLPKDKIRQLALDYYVNDKEVQESVQYLHGSEFAKIWSQLGASMEFKEFVYYLNDAGLPVVQYLNKLAGVLGLPNFPSKASVTAATMRTGGLKGFYDDLLALLPKEEIKALYNEKMKTSKDFKELYDKIAAADFQRLVKFIKDSQELSHVFKSLREHGIEVDRIIDIIVRIFGWKQ